tara:strand:+ start:234 stop:743 length:510 start_codon:yes stop_codon:yes gene_type:complete
MGYQLIETIEVGAGGAASIEFTGIPQDGVDLAIKYSLRSNRAASGDSCKINLNANTGSVYGQIRLDGNGSGTANGSGTFTTFYSIVNGDTDTSNTFGNAEFYVSNYTSSAFKSCSDDSVYENNGTTAFQRLLALSFNSTSAISSIQMAPNSGSAFMQYSTASLYKITAD